jgi:hypothetical protein
MIDEDGTIMRLERLGMPRSRTVVQPVHCQTVTFGNDSNRLSQRIIDSDAAVDILGSESQSMPGQERAPDDENIFLRPAGRQQVGYLDEQPADSFSGEQSRRRHDVALF